VNRIEDMRRDQHVDASLAIATSELSGPIIVRNEDIPNVCGLENSVGPNAPHVQQFGELLDQGQRKKRFKMKALSTFALLGVLTGFVLLDSPAVAQDCDAMIEEIDELLRTSDLSQEQKDQVMQLRDQGEGENTRAGGDCTTPLSEALNILKGE
jgi:hypothetical protein